MKQNIRTIDYDDIDDEVDDLIASNIPRVGLWISFRKCNNTCWSSRSNQISLHGHSRYQHWRVNY